jgi:ketosteroid isomerase-like protein
MRRYSFAAFLPCVVLIAYFVIPWDAAPSSVSVPDEALLQKIWDGWETLDASHQTQFYAQGPHTFFDEAPLKYESWKQFESGVSKILSLIRSAKFKVQEPHIHPAGEYVWATALINQDGVLKDGKRDATVLRWTVVFHRENGKWLIVHEHVSRPTE